MRQYKTLKSELFGYNDFEIVDKEEIREAYEGEVEEVLDSLDYNDRLTMDTNGNLYRSLGNSKISLLSDALSSLQRTYNRACEDGYVDDLDIQDSIRLLDLVSRS